MARRFLCRLSKADVESLARSHGFLNQAIQLLMTTNAAAAASAIPLIGNADSVICALYNKAERALLGAPAPESTGSPRDALPESSPGTTAGEPGNPTYGKEGA